MERERSLKDLWHPSALTSAPQALLVLNSLLKMADDDVEVTWEDQQSINAFGRLNNLLGELRASVERKKVLTILCLILEDKLHYFEPFCDEMGLMKWVHHFPPVPSPPPESHSTVIHLFRYYSDSV